MSILDQISSVLMSCIHGISRNMESTRISNLAVILCVSLAKLIENRVFGISN